MPGVMFGADFCIKRTPPKILTISTHKLDIKNSIMKFLIFINVFWLEKN